LAAAPTRSSSGLQLQSKSEEILAIGPGSVFNPRLPRKLLYLFKVQASRIGAPSPMAPDPFPSRYTTDQLNSTALKWGSDGELSELDLQRILGLLSQVDPVARALVGSDCSEMAS